MTTAGKDKTGLWIARFARGHLRLWISIALGAAIFALTPASWRPETRLLIGWDIGVVFYLSVVAVMMARASVTHIKYHADLQDEGAFAILLLTVAAAVASLGAIFAELAAIDRSQPGYGLYVALAVATVILSWTFTHTIFTLHYAYEFYGTGKRTRGLDFPGDQRPDYWDFVYFSFVIGMTFQVSDVAVRHKKIRRTVVAHGALSFLFSATILALAVNVAASLVGSR